MMKSRGPEDSVIGICGEEPGGRRKTRRLLVGMCVATAVAAGVAATGMAVTSTADAATKTAGGDGFCVEMTDAIGLYKDNPVTQMGLQVGTVSDVRAHGDRVKITFSLDSGRAYPAGVRAVTRSKSLLADRGLELVGNYADGPTLRPGECISMENSFTPKPISEVAGSASDFLKGLANEGGVDLKRALNGADRALEGTGAKANSMFRNAARAALDPDRFVSDIGSSIRDMAPLTDDAVKNWDAIMSLADQAPEVTELGTTLFYDVAKFCRGIGWVIAMLYDIQQNYGPELEKIVLDVGTPVLHEVAGQAPAWGKNLSELSPAIGEALRAQTASTGSLSLPYDKPSVKVSKEQCKALGSACKADAGKTTSVNPIDLVLKKAGAK